MSKVVDVRSGGGDFVVLGKAFVLPSSDDYGTDMPMDGSLRFNPANNDIEMSFQGVWSAIQGGSGGGPITVADVIGLQSAFNTKSPVVHTHAMSEVTGLMAALDGKANTNHGHAISTIPNLQPTLDSMQLLISNKSDTGHSHQISAVIGLETALGGKSPIGHTHLLADIPTLPALIDLFKTEKVAFSLPGSPPTYFTFAWVSGLPTTFPDNFSGSFASVDVPPVSDYPIIVRQGTSTVATITIKPNGSVVFDTSFSYVYVGAGQKLTFICPIKDAGISGISITLMGKKS